VCKRCAIEPGGGGEEEKGLLSGVMGDFRRKGKANKLSDSKWQLD
jgi:hypothetical protein